MKPTVQNICFMTAKISLKSYILIALSLTKLVVFMAFLNTTEL